MAPAGAELRGRGRWRRPNGARTGRTITDFRKWPTSISGTGTGLQGERDPAPIPDNSLTAPLRVHQPAVSVSSASASCCRLRRQPLAGQGGVPARSSKPSNPCLLLFYYARLCRLSRPLGDWPRQALHMHSRVSVPPRRHSATGRKNRPMLSIGWVILDLCNAAASPGQGRRARNPDGGRPRQSLAARRTTGLRNAAEPLID